MTDKIIENNQVEIMGKIASQFTFSHQVFGEGFYMVDVLVKRLSDSEDRIPVMISERLVDVNEDYEGEYIHVMGQFRSYNRHEEKKNRLVLSVFAREVEFVEDDDENMKSNAIFLDGYICKPPVYRKTPLGRKSRIYGIENGKAEGFPRASGCTETMRKTPVRCNHLLQAFYLREQRVKVRSCTRP